MCTVLLKPLPDIPEEGLESQSVEDEDSNNCEMMSTSVFHSFWNKRMTSVRSSNGSSGGVENGSPNSATSSIPDQDISKSNWKLWSVWNPKLVAFPLFQGSLDGVSSVACSKGKLEELVNSVFENLNEELYEELQMGDFEVFRIAKDKVEEGYFRHSESLEMQAQEINFKFVLSQEKAVIARHPVYLRSFVGLAEILRGIIIPSDILIISGGFQFITDHCRYDLNCDENSPIQIIRISQNASKQDINLFERIIPCQLWKRFQFRYRAEKVHIKRTVTVVRHKSFIHAEFCRNVTDTLAYTQSTWDFPMPIICGVDPTVIFDFLLNPHLKMPTEPARPLNPPLFESSPCNSSGESIETEAVDPDSSYYTATPDNSNSTSPIPPREQTREEVTAGRVSMYMRMFKANPPHRESHRVHDDFDSSTSSEDSQNEKHSTTSDLQPGHTKLHLYGIPAGGTRDPPPSCEKQQNGHCFCICSYIIWLLALAFGVSVIFAISAIYVFSGFDVCPLKPETTTSAEMKSNSNYNLFGYLNEDAELEGEIMQYQHLFKDNPWVRENWGKVKGWLSYLVQWINENCSLECVLAKFGIWIDVLQVY